MSAPELGPWRPLSLEAVITTFESVPFRWWISGGHALELHVQRRWRDHADTDVGVLRKDLPAVHAHLDRWDIQVAAGSLRPWRGEPLHIDRHENNLWCRATAHGPWILDVTIGEGSDERWVYRRDPSVHLPWDLAVLHTAEGTPYLAPELQLLYKSTGLRPKDDLDAAEVIPTLNARQRDQLTSWLDPAHPWQPLLA